MLLFVATAWALDPIPHAVAVHLSAAGLEHLGEGIAALAPQKLTIGTTAGELVCDEGQPEAVLSYALDGLDVGINISDVEMVPSNGRLDLYLRGTIGSSRGSLTVSGDCAVLVDLAEVCSVELPVTTLEAHIGLGLVAIPGGVDATVDVVELNLSPIGNPLDNCLLSSAIGTLLGQNSNAITDLLLGLVEPSLADLGASLEEPIEDAFQQLSLSTELSLGSSTVGIALAPDTLEIDNNGLLIGVSATITGGEPHPCVPEGTPPGTDAAWPSFSGLAPDGSLAYDAAVMVNKQLVDALLYTVWQSGMLCLSVQDAGGLSLDTSLFGPVFGEAFEALFPVSKPLTLVIAADQPPAVRFSDNDSPIRLLTEGIALRGYAELDNRQAKAFGVDLAGEIGLDLPYENGTLTPALVIDPTLLHFVEQDHELLPFGYSDGLAELVPQLLSSVLPADLLPVVSIPTYQGLGLAGLWWMPDESGQWLGGYALLSVDSVEPIELPGCEGASLGCDGGSLDYDIESALGCGEEGTGCDNGCSGDSCSSGGECTTAPKKKRGGSPLPWLVVGATLWWRRRVG